MALAVAVSLAGDEAIGAAKTWRVKRDSGARLALRPGPDELGSEAVATAYGERHVAEIQDEVVP